MRLIVSLLTVVIVFTISCGSEEGTKKAARNGSEASSDSVSVVRIWQGEKVGEECTFGEDISQYPVTYSDYSEDCLQAVRIGPIDPDALERMKQEKPVFWENSNPYYQVLWGEWIDGECKFTAPIIKAYEEFVETVSTDWTACQRTVEMGPVTEKQIDEIQHLGTSVTEVAVPAEPVRGR